MQAQQTVIFLVKHDTKIVYLKAKVPKLSAAAWLSNAFQLELATFEIKKTVKAVLLDTRPITI